MLYDHTKGSMNLCECQEKNNNLSEHSPEKPSLAVKKRRVIFINQSNPLCINGLCEVQVYFWSVPPTPNSSTLTFPLFMIQFTKNLILMIIY